MALVERFRMAEIDQDADVLRDGMRALMWSPIGIEVSQHLHPEPTSGR